MAHGIFRYLVNQQNLGKHFIIESAGTHGWNNQPPDMFARTIAAQKGISLDDLRSRKLTLFDLDSADYVLLADGYNYEYIRNNFKRNYSAKIQLLTEYHSTKCLPDIPDPYGSSMEEFEQVFDMIYLCCNGLLNQCKKEINVRGK